MHNLPYSTLFLNWVTADVTKCYYLFTRDLKLKLKVLHSFVILSMQLCMGIASAHKWLKLVEVDGMTILQWIA